MGARSRSWATRSSPAGLTAFAVALPGLAALAVHRALIDPPWLDDAYIFYRYASNWAHGLGPVFNRGEHVEGFTSFLWTATLALADAIGIAPQHAGPALALVLAFACVVLLAGLAWRALPDARWLAPLPPLALALSPAFAAYAGTGMDTIMFAFVLLCAVAASARHVDALRIASDAGRATAWWALAWLALLVLARAEGAIYALVIAAAALLLAGRGRRTRALLPLGTVVVVVVVSAVRELVYGSLVPASVSAKGYTTHLGAEIFSGRAPVARLTDALHWGFDYLGAPALIVLGLMCVALVVERRRQRRLHALATLSVLAVAVAIASALWDTGDWMPYRRLLVPVLPLLLLGGGWALVTLAGALLERAAAARRLRGGALALGAAGGCALALAAGGLADAHPPSRAEEFELAALAGMLRDSPAPARLETNVAGTLPYYAGARTFVWDMLGLTDGHNARHGEIFSPQYGRTDPGYDFSRPFDALVTNSSWDFALLLQSAALLPGGPDRYALLPARRWIDLPLYVAVRLGSPPAAGLERRCGCRPVVLSSGARAHLMASLERQGAVPDGLLTAARRRRPYPA